jgi:hypothetical protein
MIHSFSAAIVAELLVIFAIFVGAIVLTNAGAIANAIQQWGW